MTEYLEILNIYKLPLIAGITSAVTLSLLGVQLAARERVVQTIFIAQLATFGSMLGIGIALSLTTSGSSLRVVLPFFIAAIITLLGYFQSETILDKFRHSKTTILISLYISVLAATYLVTSILPMLEAHMSQIFFGDLATISDAMSISTIVISIGVGLYLIVANRKVTNEAFDEMILGGLVTRNHSTRFSFKIITVVYICFMIQSLGFLFTAGTLFLPTTLTLLSNRKGLRTHNISVAALSFFGVLTGFLVAMSSTSLPTVPNVLIFIVLFGFLLPWV